MGLHCPKCLCSQTGDVLGAKCQRTGCDGIIEERPTFASLVEALTERMTCGRRVEQGRDREGGPFKGSGSGLDYWQRFKRNGDRVCSYCGSLHPEDFLRFVHEAAVAPEGTEGGEVPLIEPSDKGYKIYVRRVGVRNAHEGGIKFYTQHLPRDEKGALAVTEAQQEEYRLAQRASRLRFERVLAARRKGSTAANEGQV